ncbi:MAG TPA: hypothetical protein VJ783_08070 [Pirellulales bacterium]|nr:hypothetical protein [Pirellulales bacterium]
MPRPQFTLRALLVLMLVVAAFFGGMALQKRLDDPTSLMPMMQHQVIDEVYSEVIRLRDGSVWERTWRREPAKEWAEQLNELPRE